MLKHINIYEMGVLWQKRFQILNNYWLVVMVTSSMNMRLITWGMGGCLSGDILDFRIKQNRVCRW